MNGNPPHPFLLSAIVSALLFSSPALAHRVSSVSLVCHLDAKGRTYLLDAAMEVVPSDGRGKNGRISPEEAAREIADYLVVKFDEVEQKPDRQIEWPEEGDGGDSPPRGERSQRILAKLRGKIPDGAKEFLLHLDPRCPVPVVMTVGGAGPSNRRMQLVLAGERSHPVGIAPPGTGETPEPGLREEGAPASVPEIPGPPDRSGAFAAGWRAFFLSSPLPSLLVVGMLLLTLGRTSVLWQAGVLLATQGLAFALAAWSLVPAPPWSGPLLAALVAAVALEAIFHRHVRWWRYPLLAAAGACLGLSLAASASVRALVAKGELTTGQVVALLLGTEAALVLFALVAASILLLLSRFRWYREAVVNPLAALVAGGGILLAVGRFL